MRTGLAAVFMAALDAPDFPLAKCKGVTHDKLFFPTRDRSSHGTARRSKEICNGKDGFGICPHITDCGAWALEHKQRHGIWGGMSERDRGRQRREIKVEQKLSERRDTPVAVEAPKRRRRQVYIGGRPCGSNAHAA